MRLVLLAPPGAGKGTQGKRLAEIFGVPHIATGDLLRKHVREGTDIGQRIGDQIDAGRLVPDELVLDMVRDAITGPEAAAGYILDGYPRTMKQAIEGGVQAHEIGRSAQAAVYLAAEKDELMRRLLQRAQQEGRADDTEDVIRHRLQTYRQETAPVIEHYRNDGLLIEVDGMQPIEAVTADIVAKVRALVPEPSGRP
jgi:adenylate kinase